MGKRILYLHDFQNTADLPDFSHDEVVVRHISTDLPPGKNAQWDEVRIDLEDAYFLQGLAAYLELSGSTRNMTIMINSRVSAQILHAPTGRIDGRSVTMLERHESNQATSLRIRLGWNARAWVILAACTSAQGQQFSPTRHVRLGVPLGMDPSWFGLNANNKVANLDHHLVIDKENPGPTPRSDLLIRPAQSPESEPQEYIDAHRTLEHTDTTWNSPTTVNDRASAFPPAFEPRIFNPVGSLRLPSRDFAHVIPYGNSGFSVEDEDGTVLSASARYLEARLVNDLRHYRALVDYGSAHAGPTSRASFILNAMAAGIPVISADASKVLKGLLPTELLDCILLSPDSIGTPELREKAIFTQVRAAHDALPGILRRAYGSTENPIEERSVSAIISTMRPDYVAHAIQNFALQRWEQKELILGFHGFSFDDLDVETQQLIQEHATYFEFDTGTIFGDVLRKLTLAAQGTIIAKMDDDDWYSPYHLTDLVYALTYSGADLVGSGFQFIYMHNADVTIRRSTDIGYRYGGHPGGPTFMTGRDTILSVGNWPRVRRAVDTGLIDAILRAGGSVFQSHPHNFLFNRRSSGHTWKATNEYFIARATDKWEGLWQPEGFNGIEVLSSHWRSEATYLGNLHRSHRGDETKGRLAKAGSRQGYRAASLY